MDISEKDCLDSSSLLPDSTIVVKHLGMIVGVDGSKQPEDVGEVAIKICLLEQESVDDSGSCSLPGNDPVPCGLDSFHRSDGTVGEFNWAKLLSVLLVHSKCVLTTEDMIQVDELSSEHIAPLHVRELRCSNRVEEVQLGEMYVLAIAFEPEKCVEYLRAESFPGCGICCSPGILQGVGLLPLQGMLILTKREQQHRAQLGLSGQPQMQLGLSAVCPFLPFGLPEHV